MSKEFDFFRIPDPPVLTDDVTRQEAARIISLFRQGKDETMIFVENGFPVRKIEQAKREWERMKDEVYRRISEQYPTPGEKGGYYTPATKTGMQSALSASKLFSSKEIVDDVLAYDGKDPARPLTFAKFKEKYYTEEVKKGDVTSKI